MIWNQYRDTWTVNDFWIFSLFQFPRTSKFQELKVILRWKLHNCKLIKNFHFPNDSNFFFRLVCRYQSKSGLVIYPSIWMYKYFLMKKLIFTESFMNKLYTMWWNIPSRHFQPYNLRKKVGKKFCNLIGGISFDPPINSENFLCGNFWNGSTSQTII